MVPLSFVKPLQFLILIAALASLSGELKRYEKWAGGVFEMIYSSVNRK